MFARPWLVDGATGQYSDLIDGKPFSTEFSHTRFLVPELMNYQGWALFVDGDMLFLSDIKKLFKLVDPKCAVMCVKHNHVVDNLTKKMDDRVQLQYYRKNWSSFVLWNCAHPANRFLTRDKVNFMPGRDLHAFSWLKDEQIGALPYTYNYISGVSPKITEEQKVGHMPDVIHYTEGGPWFEECKDIPYESAWLQEYEEWQKDGAETKVCSVPTLKYEDGRI